MGIIAGIILGLGAGRIANMLIPGRRSHGLILTCLSGRRGTGRRSAAPPPGGALLPGPCARSHVCPQARQLASSNAEGDRGGTTESSRPSLRPPRPVTGSTWGWLAPGCDAARQERSLCPPRRCYRLRARSADSAMGACQPGSQRRSPCCRGGSARYAGRARRHAVSNANRGGHRDARSRAEGGSFAAPVRHGLRSSRMAWLFQPAARYASRPAPAVRDCWAGCADDS